MSKYIKTAGTKIDMLLVLKDCQTRISKNGKRKYKYWLVQCDCGSEPRYIEEYTLFSKKKASCGCNNKVRKDVSGLKFGKLTVSNQKRKNINSPNNEWLCFCDCGGEIWVQTVNLNRGHTNSCGCLGTGKLLDNLACKNDIFRTIKSSAKIREIEFYLTKDQVFDLIAKNCYYCGSKPSNFKRDRSSDKLLYYNGIDRVDNDIGYKLENCVPACGFCNSAKLDYTVDEFKDKIKQIYNHWIKKKADI